MVDMAFRFPSYVAKAGELTSNSASVYKVRLLEACNHMYVTGQIELFVKRSYPTG